MNAMPDSPSSPAPLPASDPPADAPATSAPPQDQAATLRRAQNYFLHLARRAEASPRDADILAATLGRRVAQYWEPALEAALQAAESAGYANVNPLIDQAIAKSLRENPDLKLVAALYDRIPLDTLSLRETALEVFRQTVRAMEERGRVELHPAGYLTIVLNFVARLNQAGCIADAEAFARQALDFARARVPSQPDEFVPLLADCLETWATVNADLGRLAESRQAREEALPLLRDRPEKKAALAQVLNNHASVLKSLGESRPSLECSKEAVTIYRELVREKGAADRGQFSRGLQAWVDDPRPRLGDALVGLSSHQNELGLRFESLASAQEGFAILFELSEDFPDQFRHHLGMARHNLAMAKFGVGDAAGGLAEMQAAANLYEKLAQDFPGAHQPAYAHILGSLALAYAKNDREREALAPVEQAVALYRDLVKQNSAAYQPALRKNLTNLRLLYEAFGQTGRAAETVAELAATDPATSPATNPR